MSDASMGCLLFLISAPPDKLSSLQTHYFDVTNFFLMTLEEGINSGEESDG